MSSRGVVRDWLQANPCVEQWINKYDARNRFKNACLFYDFFVALTKEGRFKDFTVEQLLDFQDKAVGRVDKYAIGNFLNSWIDQKNLGYYSKQLYRSIPASFFSDQHVPLPKDTTFTFHPDKPQVPKDLFVDDLRKIVLSSDHRYQAIFLMMFQAGLDSQSMVHVNNTQTEHILSHLDDAVIQLTLPGRKKLKNRYQTYTFIGTDATNAIHEYRKYYPHTTPLFLNDRGNPLTTDNIQRAFSARLRALGIIKPYSPPCPNCGGETVKKFYNHAVYTCQKCGNQYKFKDFGIDKNTLCGIRYNASGHELRDTFKTEWHRAGGDPQQAEFMMNHEIDKNGYDKLCRHPEVLRAAYVEVLPWLNILSEDPRKIDRLNVEATLVERDKELAVLRREIGELQEFQRKTMVFIDKLRNPENLKRFLKQKF